MRKTFLNKVGDKFEKSQLVKTVNRKLDIVNKFFDEGKKGQMHFSMKTRKLSKSWSPMEKSLLQKI